MQGRTKQSEADLLEPGISKLVRVLKRDLQKKYGHVDYNKLRKDGFSDSLLTRLQKMDLKRSSPPSAGSSLRA